MIAIIGLKAMAQLYNCSMAVSSGKIEMSETLVRRSYHQLFWNMVPGQALSG